MRDKMDLNDLGDMYKCVGLPEIVYSEKDQALIDTSKKNLADYEESLLLRLKRDGIQWAATPQELRCAFINDPTRKALVDTVISAYETLIPERTLYVLERKTTGDDHER